MQEKNDMNRKDSINSRNNKIGKMQRGVSSKEIVPKNTKYKFLMLLNQNHYQVAINGMLKEK
jgi:hypothetical protein